MADELDEYLARKRGARAPAPTPAAAADDELAAYLARKQGATTAVPPSLANVRGDVIGGRIPMPAQQEDRVAPGGLAGVITGQRPAPSLSDAVLQAGGQTLSAGFGDEINAGIATAAAHIPGVRTIARPLYGDLVNPDLTYRQRRDLIRGDIDAAREAHPYASMATDALTGVAATALMPASAAASIGRGGSTLGAIGRAAATNATLGAFNGAGTSKSDTLAGQARDIGVNAAVAGAVGGVAETAAALLTRRAAERVATDITRHINEGSGEHGAATATARKLVARDKVDIVDVVTSDPAIARAVRQPAKDALPVVRAKLAEEGAQLAPHYAVVDQAVGGVRVGDYVDHLEAAAAKLRASAGGKDAQVADQLEQAAKRVRNGADWGATTRFDPHVEVTPGVTAEQQIALMQRVMRADPAHATAAQQEIQRVQALATRRVYDPDRVVPTRQLRANVTDLQSAAFDSLGGINGTNAHQKAREVAGVGQDFLNAHLDSASRAGDAAANAVEDIRTINPRFSALKNIEKAIEQRGEKEAAGATSLVTKIMHGGGALGAVHSVATGHLGRAALEIGGAYVAPKVARIAGPAANRELARLMIASRNGSVTAGLVQQAIEAGVPRVMAERAAGMAAQAADATDGDQP